MVARKGTWMGMGRDESGESSRSIPRKDERPFQQSVKSPFSHKQIKFYTESDARINIAEGAVRSGKSFVALFRFLDELRRGPDGNYAICGKSERTVLRNVIDPLQEIVGGIIRYNRGLGEFTLFGRKVYVIGANDERASEKIQGATFAGSLVDEITILPETFVRMLLTRLSVPFAKLIGTTNPDSPYHWLKTEFIDKLSHDPSALKTFKFTLEDNPSLTESYKSSLRKEHSGLWYRRFILGEWVLAEGAVFDFFNRSLHIVPAPPSYAKYYILGVDYGTTNPFAAVLIGFNDDVHPSIWVEKEWYFNPKVTGYQRTDSEFAHDLKREFGDYPVKQLYLDPSAQSFEVELRRQKWPVRQANNEVLAGIRFIGSMLSRRDLVICQGCDNLVKEIEGYVWDENSVKLGMDKPVKQRDHAVDAVRYAVFTHWGHKEKLRENSSEDAELNRFKKNPMAYPGFAGQAGWQVLR